MVSGNDYRFLVVDGRMAAVAQRVPRTSLVTGRIPYASSSDLVNADPRRGLGHEKILTQMRIDDEAERLLREQGRSLDDVPGEGHVVRIAATGNMSTGGSAIDRTWDAHDDNIDIAEEAARVVGLDVAGIDFLAPDISKPVRETGGAIVEVNAAPGFRMHTNPTEGEPQYVAKPVIDLLFPPGRPSRIPIVAVTGSNGKTTTVRMISHIMRGKGHKVGMTSTDGIYIDDRLSQQVDASGPRSAQKVLQNPRIDLAVFEVARGGILREGLGYGRNDVAVVLNVTGDHLGLGEIETLEQLAAVKQVIVEAVPRDGTAVLNADDPLVAEMRRHCSGSVILFSMQEGNELVERWVRRGRKAVVLERDEQGEVMLIRDGRRTMPIGYVHLFPSTFDGRARMNVQNAMAAAAAAHAAGAHLHDIRSGLAHVLLFLLPVAREAEPGRVRGHEDPGRLRPQPGGSANGWGVRGTHDVGCARFRWIAERDVASEPPRWGDRHSGRPTRRRHPGARPRCRQVFRRDHRPRGSEYPWAPAR